VHDTESDDAKILIFNPLNPLNGQVGGYVMQSLYMFLEPPLGVSKGVWSDGKCCVSK